MSLRCQICASDRSSPDVFDLSDEREPPTIPQLCGRCAHAEYVRLEIRSQLVEVHRSDYLRADRAGPDSALEAARDALGEFGWRLRGLRIHGELERIIEPTTPHV